MKVLHTLAELNHSGAERMLACSYGHWRAADVDPFVVGMAEESHPFAPMLTDAGYDVKLLPGIRSAKGLAALWRTLQAVRPTIVHVHAESGNDAVAYLAALTPGVEGIVRTVHSNFRFTGQLRVRRQVRVAAARTLGVEWVACSEEVAENERTYFGRRPIRVIENWVDVETIAAEATGPAGAGVRGELGMAPDATVLALIGNCGNPKNHELVPEALAGVEAPIEILHVGHRGEEPDVEAVAWRSLPARHAVHHLGMRTDVPALLAASDLVVHPSLYEGFPLVPAEALCAGVPLLAGDTIGLRWLGEVRSATLVPLRAPDWAAAIAKLTANPDPKAANESATEARIRFDPKRGVAEYLDAYRAALETRLLLKGRRRDVAPGAELG